MVGTRVIMITKYNLKYKSSTDLVQNFIFHNEYKVGAGIYQVDNAFKVRSSINYMIEAVWYLITPIL